jgi:hypothetical protein
MKFLESRYHQYENALREKPAGYAKNRQKKSSRRDAGSAPAGSSSCRIGVAGSAADPPAGISRGPDMDCLPSGNTVYRGVHSGTVSPISPVIRSGFTRFSLSAYSSCLLNRMLFRTPGKVPAYKNTRNMRPGVPGQPVRLNRFLAPATPGTRRVYPFCSHSFLPSGNHLPFPMTAIRGSHPAFPCPPRYIYSEHVKSEILVRAGE